MSKGEAIIIAILIGPSVVLVLVLAVAVWLGAIGEALSHWSRRRVERAYDERDAD